MKGRRAPTRRCRAGKTCTAGSDWAAGAQWGADAGSSTAFGTPLCAQGVCWATLRGAKQMPRLESKVAWSDRPWSVPAMCCWGRGDGVHVVDSRGGMIWREGSGSVQCTNGRRMSYGLEVLWQCCGALPVSGCSVVPSGVPGASSVAHLSCCKAADYLWFCVGYQCPA